MKWIVDLSANFSSSTAWSFCNDCKEAFEIHGRKLVTMEKYYMIQLQLNTAKITHIKAHER